MMMRPYDQRFQAMNTYTDMVTCVLNSWLKGHSLKSMYTNCLEMNKMFTIMLNIVLVVTRNSEVFQFIYLHICAE